MRQTFRTALVTGASSGIGESMARELAKRGTELILVARREDLLTRLAADLPVKATVLPADLTDPDQLAAVEDHLRTSRVELLVNNAGFGAFGPVAEIPIDEQVKEIQLNVTALVRLSHAALPAMLERGGGGILNVASMAGYTPAPGSAVYGATKSFVTSFTESLHTEVRGTGVHVTALCPGFTRTADTAKREFLWLRRADVARSGLDAVAAGRALCIPGAQYKAVYPVLKAAPRLPLRRAVSLMWQRAAATVGRDE
jgi:short-subunit dehydrogenase